jgi:hypothetical protein
MKNPNEPEGCPILENTFPILLFPVTDADFLNVIRQLNHPNLLAFVTFQVLISKVRTISIVLRFYLSVSLLLVCLRIRFLLLESSCYCAYFQNDNCFVLGDYRPGLIFNNFSKVFQQVICFTLPSVKTSLFSTHFHKIRVYSL